MAERASRARLPCAGGETSFVENRHFNWRVMPPSASGLCRVILLSRLRAGTASCSQGGHTGDELSANKSHHRGSGRSDHCDHNACPFFHCPALTEPWPWIHFGLYVPSPQRPEGAIVALESLAGKQIAAFIPSLNEGVESLSPSRRLFITQPGLEPILRNRAAKAGAKVLDGKELIGIEQDDDGVTAIVKDSESGDEHRLRARYLVGADGAHSRTRELCGIPFDGRGVFSNSITIYFHADVARLMEGRNLSVMYIINPTLSGFIRLDRNCQAGFLVVNTVGDTSKPETGTRLGIREINSLSDCAQTSSSIPAERNSSSQCAARGSAETPRNRSITVAATPCCARNIAVDSPNSPPPAMNTVASKLSVAISSVAVQLMRRSESCCRPYSPSWCEAPEYRARYAGRSRRSAIGLG